MTDADSLLQAFRKAKREIDQIGPLERVSVHVHPANFERILSQCSDNGNNRPTQLVLAGVPIYQNEHVPQCEPTGKVIWPDGTITEPSQHRGRFVDFERKDLHWMIPLGAAQWEMVPVCWIVRERNFLGSVLQCFSERKGEAC